LVYSYFWILCFGFYCTTIPCPLAVGSSGKLDETAYLKGLGATEVIERSAVTEGAERPMLKPVWAGVVDCVGGEMLAAAIKATRNWGVVTCCGLAPISPIWGR